MGRDTKLTEAFRNALEREGVDPVRCPPRGLKLFLSLAVIGWSGYRAHVERTLELADGLRERLRANNWRVVNEGPLAVLCFVGNKDEDLDSDAIANHVVAEAGLGFR